MFKFFLSLLLIRKFINKILRISKIQKFFKKIEIKNKKFFIKIILNNEYYILAYII